MQTSVPPTGWTALIPELQDWNEGKGIDPLSWVGCTGSLQIAIGYSVLFWPDFFVFGDYVFRERVDEQLIRSWEKSTGGKRSRVEAVLNHLHIADIHNGDISATEDQLRFLGRVLKSAYQAKLRSDFPDRRFEVRFKDDPGLDLIDYQLTFWQLELPD